MQGMNRVGQGGRACYVTPDLREERAENILTKKMQGMNRIGQGGRTCYVTPDLSYD